MSSSMCSCGSNKVGPNFIGIPLNPAGHIEMGRVITGAANPVILYVSGGNTQVGACASPWLNEQRNCMYCKTWRVPTSTFLTSQKITRAIVVLVAACCPSKTQP